MFKFKVTPDNTEAYEVTAGSRDVAMWERTTKGKVFADLHSNLSMVDMYRIAYLASRRQGLYPGTASEFDAGVELELLEETEEPDPTQTAL